MARTLKASKRVNRLPWDGMLKNFINLKKAEGRAPRTIQDYQYHINRFFTRFPNCMEDGSLTDCANEFMAEKAAPATYNLKRQYLKAFLRWAIKEGCFNGENPFADLPKRKDTERIVVIPESILEKMFKMPDRETFTGFRDFALMSLQIETGIRPGEAMQLLLKDVDFRQNEVYVRAEVAKTRVGRTLTLHPNVMKILMELKMIIEANFEDADTMPLFCSWEGRPLKSDYWSKRLKKYYSDKLEYEHEITPYCLRHMYAVTYLKNCGDLVKLQANMGHSSLEMTKRYLHFVRDDFHEVQTKASPFMSIMKPKKQRITKIK